MEKCVVLGNQKQSTKNRIIGQRLRYGWMCFKNRKTRVRHIWVSPKSMHYKKYLKRIICCE